MKQPHFLHVDANLQKLKVLCWAWSKVGLANMVLGL